MPIEQVFLPPEPIVEHIPVEQPKIIEAPKPEIVQERKNNLPPKLEIIPENKPLKPKTQVIAEKPKTESNKPNLVPPP